MLPTPPLALREGVNVLLTRTEEIQKVHTNVSAGLANMKPRASVFRNLDSGGGERALPLN